MNEPRSMPAPTGVAMSPAPTADETAAIVAAVHALWPRPAATVDPAPPRNTGWRFSNRWWARPTPVRRERPWR